ncbi:MAG: hypothetical protein ACREA9_03530 [Pyrinomonadaceae bacterium]
MLLHPPKTKAAQLGNLRLLLVLAALLVAPCPSLTVRAQQTTEREIAFPVTVHWNWQKSVSRYRLQIAADAKFRNVFFDRRVIGNRCMVSELPPGYYYWRVAPADSLVGYFSRPVRFFVSGGVVTNVKLPSRAKSLPAIGSRRVPSGFVER